MKKILLSLQLLAAAALLSACSNSNDKWRNWEDRPLSKTSASLEAEVFEAEEVSGTDSVDLGPVAVPDTPEEPAEVVPADPIFEEAGMLAEERIADEDEIIADADELLAEEAIPETEAITEPESSDLEDAAEEVVEDSIDGLSSIDNAIEEMEEKAQDDLEDSLNDLDSIDQAIEEMETAAEDDLDDADKLLAEAEAILTDAINETSDATETVTEVVEEGEALADDVSEDLNDLDALFED